MFTEMSSDKQYQKRLVELNMKHEDVLVVYNKFVLNQSLVLQRPLK